MKLGDVRGKERERGSLSRQEMASRLGVMEPDGEELEAGKSPAEVWGPRRAQMAIAPEMPTSRVISETGKSAGARRVAGQCGKLITTHRERRDVTGERFAKLLGVPSEVVLSAEAGERPLQEYGPLLLQLAEIVQRPIFNLPCPCDMPWDQLDDKR